MAENQKRILEMLAEKKITVNEAERLLSLVDSGAEEGASQSHRSGISPKTPAKYLRVVVTPDADSMEEERVNIRVPVSLIRAGMKFTSLIPYLAGDEVQKAMNEKGVKIDLNNFKDSNIDELVSALNDLEVDVDDRKGKKTVRVYTE